MESQDKLHKDNSTSWTNRALDWYNSERRLIFAVDPSSSTFKEIDKQFFMGEITQKMSQNQAPITESTPMKQELVDAEQPLVKN